MSVAEIVKIATYNTLVESWARNNKPCYNGITWETRRDGLVEKILAIDPDIIALQEVDRFDSLAEKMAQVGYHGVHAKRNNHEQEGCALFFNPKKVAIIRDADNRGQTIHYFNDGTGRMIQQVAFKVLSVEHPPITVLNTHLLYTEAQVPGAQNKNRTESELRALQDLSNQLASQGKPVVVCGDFNIPAGAPSLQRFHTEGFVDPLETSSAPTFMWGNSGSRIDYTWSRNIQPLKSEVVGDPDKLQGIEEPSDHLPIITTYALPTQTNLSVESVAQKFAAKEPSALQDFEQLPQAVRNKIYANFYTLIKPALTNDYFGVGEKVFLGLDTQVSPLHDLRALAITMSL